MLLALLLALTGGRVYLAHLDAGGAQVALWRYAAAGRPGGAPVLLFPELGFAGRDFFDLEGKGLARALQARGREVFVVEWRGTGHSTLPVRTTGGLDALFGGDAEAALREVLAATRAPCAQLVGVGLGGAAAYLLSGRACAVVAVSVPAVWQVPNEAARRLLAAVRAVARRVAPDERPIRLAPWASFPDTLDPLERRDLFTLLLAHGDALPGRSALLRAALGSIAPELASDAVRWMEEGDLALPEGPLGPARRLSRAIESSAVPLLVVAAPRDDLVHPEHALHLRRPHDELVLSRVEGFSEDAGHLALQAPWAERELYPRLWRWLDSH